MKNDRIRDVMSSAPLTIGSDQKLSVAHAMMREHELRHLPVLRGGSLVGILTQRDLYFLERISGVDAAIDIIADAMTPDVFTTTPDALVSEVAQTMAKHRYGCAVVVDDEKVTGIFTTTDALHHLADVLA